MRVLMWLGIGFYAFMGGTMVLAIILLIASGLVGFAVMVLMFLFFYVEFIIETILNSNERKKRGVQH